MQMSKEGPVLQPLYHSYVQRGQRNGFCDLLGVARFLVHLRINRGTLQTGEGVIYLHAKGESWYTNDSGLVD